MGATTELRDMLDAYGIEVTVHRPMTKAELARENAKLREENAKLRELVRDMCDFFCVVPDEPHVFKEELDFSVEVWRRMRELGIEVDE